MILESNLVTNSGIARRLSKMAGPGKQQSVQEWVDTIGRDNVQLALEHGVLTQIITEDDMVEVAEVMKDGDYIVYQRDGLYVMYHMADEKLWRTEGQSVDDLVPENSKAVDGISVEDHSGRIAMSGHETPPPQDVAPGIPQEIETSEPEIEDENLDIDIEAPEEEPPLEPDMAAPEPEMATPESEAIPTIAGTEVPFESKDVKEIISEALQGACTRCNAPFSLEDERYYGSGMGYGDNTFYGRCAECQEIENRRAREMGFSKPGGGFLGDELS